MVKITRRKAVELGAIVIVASIFVGLPIYTQTSNYPLAIVQGNSMYPTLHSGDLVIFGKAPQSGIANGTIIVFVQGDTGVSSLDSIIRPVVIHRIIGTVVQADGTVYYRTKGDNNQYPDPALTEANHVLGVPIAVIPEGGILVLFLESPEGLVTLIGIITLYYLGKYEVKMKEDKTKEAFLRDLTKLVLEGELSRESFQMLEPVVRYGGGIQFEDLDDELVISLLTWMKKGGLERGWRVEKIECPGCSGSATRFLSGKDLEFVVCSRCARSEVSARRKLVTNPPLSS